MSDKFANKVKELGLAHLYGLVQKPNETDEEFKVRLSYVKFRIGSGV